MNILNYNTEFLKWLVYLIPISLVSGSFILNLNLIFISLSLALYFFLSKKTFEYLNYNWLKIAILFFFYKNYPRQNR